jgi:hypothetical protein
MLHCTLFRIRFRLRLFSANMEYYLRQMTLTSIRTFQNNGHIDSFEELFLRASIVYEHLIESLEGGGATQANICDAVFSDILLTAK